MVKNFYNGIALFPFHSAADACHRVALKRKYSHRVARWKDGKTCEEEDFLLTLSVELRQSCEAKADASKSAEQRFCCFFFLFMEKYFSTVLANLQPCVPNCSRL